ncbi:MAG: hypothetical protein GY827_05855 [Cytophagales bacterium]|nr:hypothetical protein [Cytophagales bacterium]
MKKIAFVFGILLIHLVGVAQEHIFNIVVLSGSVKLDNGTVLNNGDKLLSNQTIIMEDSSSYLALMHKTGQTVEVQKAGTYKVIELAAKINQGGDKTFMDTYSNFVVKQMVEDASQGSHNSTGAIHRDITLPNHIEVFLPKEITVMKNVPLHFSWVGPVKDDSYTVEIKDLFNQTIHKEVVTGNEIVLKLSGDDKLLTETGRPYTLIISSNTKKSIKSRDIQVLVKKHQEEANIITEYTNLKNELGTSSAVNSLILASFYKAKGLSGYAIENFENATNQAPTIEHFQRVYINYLKKEKINTSYLVLRDEQ